MLFIMPIFVKVLLCLRLKLHYVIKSIIFDHKSISMAMKRILVFSVLFLGTGLFGMQSMGQTMKNKVIAHRGAWKSETLPQNSLASLSHAIELGCGGSEFDVWMTADGEVVVNHDPTFQGLEVEKLTYKELMRKKHPNGEVLPTLKQYLELGKRQLKNGSKEQPTRLVLEIKTSGISKERTLALTAACVAQVKKTKMDQLVDYICFDYDAGLKVLELDKNAKVSFLSGSAEVTPAQLKKDGYTGFDYHFNVLKSNPEFVTQAKALGLTSNVWTVNKKEDMKAMLELGLDFITTDEPELLFKEILVEQ